MSVQIPFRHKLEFQYGVVSRVAPRIRRVIAKNPSPFTFYGTGTYILGEGDVAVIDPGPADPRHVEALLAATDGERISHVLITHTHVDHSPATALLKAAVPTTSYGFGPHGSGKLEQGAQVEEGGDMEFVPDEAVRDGDMIEGGTWSVECVYTPGHTSNHICFRLHETKALFTGDHVMGWSTSVISPPDGDMAAYMASLEKLLTRDDEVYWPTHGPAITAPKPHVEAFLEHRRERERQILHCVRQGLGTIREMVPVIYTGIAPRLFPAAGRSVLAAVELLVSRGDLLCDGLPTLASVYSLPA